MQKLQSFVEAGNTTLTISGAAGTIPRKVQGSFPSATVTVYLAGTLTLASIYADNAATPTPKANPFTAASDGTWFFYAPNGAYDVRFSGGGIAAPFTLGSFSLFDESIIWVDITASPYFATGNGTTDDTSAIQAALTALTALGGGVLEFPPGKTYKTTQILDLTIGNLVVEGNGSEILFQPTSPSTQNKAILIDSGESALRDTNAAAISKGATSFVAASAGSTSDLVPGDWLIVQEKDANLNEVVYIDWVQVASIAGTTINVLQPFRMSFPGTHGTIQFTRESTPLAHKLTIRDLRVRTTDTTNTLVGIAIYNSRSVTLENVTTSIAKGNAFASYRASDLKLIGCRQIKNGTQATEFAATVDLIIQGCTFGNFDAASNTSPLVLDYGTAFFAIIGNTIPAPAQIGMQVLYGCHDGAIIGNTWGYIRNAGIGDTSGMIVQGCQRIIITGNNFVGGAGANSQGIATSDDTTANPDLLTSGNIVANNSVIGFTFNYLVNKVDITGVYNFKTVNINKTAADYSSNPIPSQGNGTLTFTVSGATGGGEVAFASPNTNIGNGLVWSAWVSAADTVQVNVLNPTTAPITPATANWTVGVIHITP